MGFFLLFSFLKKNIFIYLNRESAHTRARGGAEGKGERERDSQADTIFRMEPRTGLNPMTPRPELELKPRIGCSTDRTTQVPLLLFSYIAFNLVGE